MIKQFLFSTVLTAAVVVSSVAMAAELPTPAKHSTKTHKPVKSIRTTKNTNRKDDAYKPHMHVEKKAKEEMEEIVVFADAKTHFTSEGKKQHVPVNSEELSVKVGGKVDIQYGSTNQRSAFKNPANNDSLPQNFDLTAQDVPNTGSKFTNQDAIVSNGELTFKAEKEHSGNKYGAQINVNANTSPSGSGNQNTATQVFLYMENKDGRFEVGATDGVSESMAISGATIAKSTGGIDGDYSNWIPYTVFAEGSRTPLQDTFLNSPNLPYASQHAKKANKLNYYTPTINGFKAGLGYVRDVTVQGTTFEALSFKDTGYQNVFELGLSYEHKVNNMSFAVSATGQTGQARNAFTGNQNNPATPLKRLGAWQVGGKVSYEAFTLAASYGDWGKSGTVKDVPVNTPKKKAQFWTAGLAYDHNDKGGMSLTYMGSQRVGAFSVNAINANIDNSSAKNKFDAISFGAEYKVMPGLMPYAEVTTFNYKTSLDKVAKNKGTVVLGGIKLNF